MSKQLRTYSAELLSLAGSRVIDWRLSTQATTQGQGTQAEAMLFHQLMRTAHAIYAMHQAVDE